MMERRSILFLCLVLSFMLCCQLLAAVTPVGIQGCDGDIPKTNLDRDVQRSENLYELMKSLSSNASEVKFSHYSVGFGSDKIYGLYQCRQDISLQVCSECVDAASKKMNIDCPLYNEAITWYNECMLRFANRSIFSLEETSPFTEQWSAASVENFKEFDEVVATTVDYVISVAANNSNTSSIHFATREASLTSSNQTLYFLAQCTPDISAMACNHCLRNASEKLINASIHVSVFLPSCQLRYDTIPFYNVSSINLSSTSSPNKPTEINVRKKMGATSIGAIAASIAIGSILLFSVTWMYLHRRKMKDRFESLRETSYQTSGDIDNIRNVESLQFDFNTIKTATHAFSEDNKLGRGGFGEVYKGKLGNGQEIAVKRLSKYSEQGTLEFKNEVVLVAKLQHRNLVKLLGFCISGKEKLLIYELLPNSSLDRFLYDPLKRASLDWETRFKIMTGIARGLLYLHEDSRLKIIHRDLKSSNVLLDQGMNAKISDFGLAKLFRIDQTQGDTNRIVGTYGYMAPEYAMAGQFSVKSDVYSFGVIVLEVVSGRRNSFYDRQPHEEGLLHRAWRLWNEEVVLELVDPSLKNKYSIEQVKMCIHIGLLCIQEDATKRPRMTSIVAAFNGQSVTLPLPNSPHFFAACAVNEDHGPKSDVYTGTMNITEPVPR